VSDDGEDLWRWRGQCLAVGAGLFLLIGALRAGAGAWTSAAVCAVVATVWGAGAAGCVWRASWMWQRACVDEDAAEREQVVLVRERAVAWGED
jgi:hypothetical protein